REHVEAVPGLAFAQDHLAAVEGEELEARDHRHQLLDREVLEQRAHDPLGAAPASPATGSASGPGNAFSRTENSSSANLLSVIGSETGGSASSAGSAAIA